MFWPFIAAGTAISLALIKLGALFVWVAVLTRLLMLAVASLIGAVLYIAWERFRSSRH